MPTNIVIQVVGKTDTNIKTERNGDYVFFLPSGHSIQKVFHYAAFHYHIWAKIFLLILNQSD